ncbi:hypothetical protein PG995_015928 [Apiospora arundinis]
MAVLDEYPGIGVVVRVHGGIVDEYPDPNPKRAPFCPSTSAYILCRDDTEFSVSLAVDEWYDFSRDEDHNLWFAVTVDGDRLKASCMITKEMVAASHGRARQSLDKTSPLSDARTGVSFVEKFRFPIMERRGADRHPQDNHAASNTGERNKRELGVIEVRVQRIVIREPVGVNAGPSLFDCFSIAERAMRGEDTTELERSVNRRAESRKVDRVQGDLGAIAIYRFLYRPRGILERLRLIPPLPPLPASTGERSAAELQDRKRRRQ